MIDNMTFRPVPKPVKKEKKQPKGVFCNGRVIQDFNKKPVKKKSPQMHRTSTGELLTQQQIDRRLTKAYHENKHPHQSICECCNEKRADEHDHTCSQRMCKILKITELIWNPENWSLSCRTCHQIWERFKSGKFTEHYNLIPRMLFLKEHDIEGFQKRINYVTDLEQINKLK